MDMRPWIVILAALVTLVTCSEEGTKINKRASEGEERGPALPADLEEGVALAEDKRGTHIFRYGRGGTVFRYGKRAPVFRYGKRGRSIFRYGKRADDEDVYDDDNDVQLGGDSPVWKRLFRWGKRDADDYKRIFRWGKRSDDEEEDEKRGFVFRYGKRADLESTLEEMLKSKLLGESEENEENAIDKRPRIFRYGRSQLGERDIRANQPHVPFRFGEE